MRRVSSDRVKRKATTETPRAPTDRDLIEAVLENASAS